MPLLNSFIPSLSTNTLRTLVKVLFESTEDESDILFETCLEELRCRLPAKEFIDFCNTLDTLR